MTAVALERTPPSHASGETSHAPAAPPRRRLGPPITEPAFEALGRAAAGMAHDLGTALTEILMRLEQAATVLPADSPAHDHLAAAFDRAVRASDVVREVASRAVGEPGRREPVDLVPLVDDVVREARRSLPGGVRLARDLPESLPAVDGRSVRLRQMLANLVANAVEATQAAGGGRVTVRATVRPAGVPSGSSAIALEVRDEGTGIAESVRDRLGRPGATTKPGGSGLGLVVVADVVREHGGRFRLTSRPEGGAIASVELPL